MPFGVPSAEAPLSPMIRKIRVSSRMEILERVDQPTHVMVGVLHKSGKDLHLAGEHRLIFGSSSSQA